MWIVAVVVVAAAALVAALATRGDSSNRQDTPNAEVVATTQAKGSGERSSAAGALPAYDSTAEDSAIGKTIPTVSGTTLDGQSITIGAADHKAKVIVFVAHWCPHCQREVPALVDHFKSTPMPSDVELLTVSTGVNASAPNYPPKAWLDRVGWKAPVLADNDNSVAKAYGLPAYPYFVVADADGKVVARGSGELTMDQFDALVKAAQTGHT